MKKLDLNTSKDLAALKKSLNAVIDKRINEQKLSEKITDMKNLSFGEYKVLFEDIMPELSNDVNGKKIIASYVKLIKENKAIKSVYKILEGKEICYNLDSNIAPYALTDVLENVDRKLLREGEQKMYSIYKDACEAVNDVTCERIDNTLNENKELNDAISYLTHKSDKSNIKALNERVNSIKALSNFVNESVGKMTPETVNETKTSGELVSELNGLFENVNTDWEHNVLQDIALCYASNGSKEELFESYKNRCIEAIDTLSNDDDIVEKSRLHGMKQQLSEKVYHAETLSEDLLKLAELRETLLSEE